MVACTSGEAGTSVDPSVRAIGEARRAEIERACELLGVSRLVVLPYRDSGLPAAAAPGTLAATPLGQVASAIATILREEHARVAVTHDERGGYGHADHVRVSAAVRSAAGAARVPKLYQSVLTRSTVDAFRRAFEAHGIRARRAAPSGADLDLEIGVDDAAATAEVDVARYVGAKRAALAAHRTQMEAHPLMRLPERVLAELWRYEHFALIGAAPLHRETDLFEGVR